MPVRRRRVAMLLRLLLGCHNMYTRNPIRPLSRWPDRHRRPSDQLIGAASNQTNGIFFVLVLIVLSLELTNVILRIG